MNRRTVALAAVRFWMTVSLRAFATYSTAASHTRPPRRARGRLRRQDAGGAVLTYE